MKKVKKNLWSEKVPFGYEKKPVFENFPFHTLGYENFGCFFLMPLTPSTSVLRSFLRPTHMPPRGTTGRAAAAADGDSPQTRATPQLGSPAGDPTGTLADITVDPGALDDSDGDRRQWPLICTSCSNNNFSSCTTMPSWRRPCNNSRGSSEALAARLHRHRHRRRTLRLSWPICPASRHAWTPWRLGSLPCRPPLGQPRQPLLRPPRGGVVALPSALPHALL
jgi:hypothetical protein